MNTKQPSNVVPFISKGKKLFSPEGEVIDHGTICGLKYEVFKRGVIHIFDGKCKFKKDAVLFEDAVEELDFDTIGDGETLEIKGSGDNDDMIFTKKDGDIKITLKRRRFKTMEKLKNILQTGRPDKKKTASK